MNLLQIVQTAATELGLPVPVSVVGSTDPQTMQLYALANREGDNLYRQAGDGWTALQTQHIVNIAAPIDTTGDITANSDTITNIPSTTGLSTAWAVSGNDLLQSARVAEVVDAHTIRMDEPATGSATGVDLTFAKDTYDIPEDFSWFINRTMWDRTNMWELIGPISPQVDQWQRSGVVAQGPRRRWRQVGLPNTCWRIWPPPSAGNDYPGTLVFEYSSAYWAKDVAGTPIPKFAADTDEPILDPQAFILGLKWRMWQIKGFDYAAMQAEYLAYVQQLLGRDGGAPDLRLSRSRRNGYLLGPWNVQDGNWPT